MTEGARLSDDGGQAVLERALLAVGRTRALGMHFYGHFVGVSGRVPTDGRALLQLEGEPPGAGTAAVSQVALATVADLAMGSAIRTRVAPGARLGTVTLSIQHPSTEVAGPLVADATALEVDADGGTAHCTVEAAGQTIGAAQAWFAALPPPPGTVLTLTPWEYDEPPAVVVPSPSELDEVEAAAVTAARAAGRRAAEHGTAVSQEILAFAWREGPEGNSAGTLQIGPELGNRVGHVQGGALYGAAALAATQALDVVGATLADGHYQFLRPADGATLTAHGTVLRRGRGVAFVESRLSVDETLVGIGLFSFRL